MGWRNVLLCKYLVSHIRHGLRRATFSQEKVFEDAGVERKANLIKLARELRKNQTKEEALLWYKFLRMYPVRFHRQYVIDRYIVDFYCHKARLVVELDGSGHYEPNKIEADRKRTEYLSGLGLEVLRFTNLEVTRQFAAVCQEIDDKVRNKKS